MDGLPSFPRLGEPLATPLPRRHHQPQYQRSCLECGTPFVSATRSSEFCTTEHRKAHGNRRAMRGAEVYDLWMALRHDRETAQLLGVWKLLCRLSAMYREEDVRDRAGRRSWRTPRQMLATRPYLSATTLTRNAGGARRG